MSDFRLMSAMVLFRFEQALGSIVLENNPVIDDQILDLADAIREREIAKRPEAVINTTAELIAETYIEDLFQLALRITQDTSNFGQWVRLKSLCSILQLYDIRNAVAHPNRPFPECYWYRVAVIASDPLIQQLGLSTVSAAFASALEGKITPPPDDWLSLPEWVVPNNLPKNSDFEITGLIGRPKESKELQKYLNNPRINCVSVVAPGGVGKTALAIDVLDKSCKTPEFRKIFDAVIFITLKLERLTASGVEKLDAPTTIFEIEAHLSRVIPMVLGDEGEVFSFQEVAKRYSDNKLLIFIDNLETLLRDSPENFDEFQINLPVHWRLLVTSRVNTNSATCLPIGPLLENTAKHLARIYATRRNASELVQEPIVDKIVRHTHCNPLAIRLGVDSYILGSSLDDSIICATNDVLNFSYRNLLEVISNESIAVLECLFLQDPQTRIELAENIAASIDFVAKGIHELARTSLITRDSAQQQELYSLYPSIRDLLLVSPRNAVIRGAIQQRILRRRTATVGAEQYQHGLSKLHNDYVPPELPEVLRNVLYETNHILGKLGRNSTPEDALKVLGRLRELRNEYSKLSVIWRYTAKISAKLGDNSTALGDLTRAIELDSSDISALKMLGRLAHDLHDYKLSLDCYTKIRDLSVWTSPEIDQQNARYCCNGYLLAQLYLGKYEDILKETRDWSTEEAFKDIRGSFRARAWKRSVENGTNVQDKSVALNKAANILEELAKEFGYPDMTRRVYQEVIEEITITSGINGFSDCKQAEPLLVFVARNITHAYKDEGQDLETVLNIAQSLRCITIKNNPFLTGEWQEFLKRKGGRVYVDEDRKNTLRDVGFVIVNVYHVPKLNSQYLFAQDASGIQYFVHFNYVSGASWQDWTRLKDGSELAIKVSPPEPGQKTARAEDVILLSVP